MLIPEESYFGLSLGIKLVSNSSQPLTRPMMALDFRFNPSVFISFPDAVNRWETSASAAGGDAGVNGVAETGPLGNDG